ncbi:esterase-like activity of phytase family protein [Devosia sp. RR2S18]|uniref:esterase-like activity of phytase family protein n=1 Tax=Devosia rhizosphaerae TaxID=3049774 RepID=UPI002540512E|nr:esterase-like activity of phytase family protein [Devosia sp. RR2S18]WIJ25656.1 esterase-like activity of phytase family protein [Devosia sp. RR2S18]
MRRVAATLAVWLLAGIAQAQPVPVSVTAAPIDTFKDVPVGGQVDGLIWRGGVSLTSQQDTFGGLSGLAVTGPHQQVVFVTDRGSFISGQLAYDDQARLFGFIGVTAEALQNSRGEVLPRQYARDAESVDTIYRNGEPIAVRVGFEHLTRVADFALVDGIPGGAAREVSIPDWLTNLRTNQSLESLCIAPPASPIAGSTLLLTEDARDEAGNQRGWFLGQNDVGPVSYRSSNRLVPTDCAFLPNGDLLVLERGVSLLTFLMAVRRVPAAEVRPGNVMVGEVLLEAQGGDVDNMEALAVHSAPDGETRILVGSDNNFNDWQRTLLLEFALPTTP